MSAGVEAEGVTATLENGLAALRVRNAFGSILVYRQGAHVVEYSPAEAPAVLFTSAASRFERGKAIRGGVPICFPWFGPHPTRSELPAHGFARTSEFEYRGSRANEGGETTLHFSLTGSDATRDAFPFEFSLDYEVTLAKKLLLRLRVTNSGAVPFTFEEALHSYFSVSDVRRVRVVGLAGDAYLDQLSGRSEVEGEHPVGIDREVDRVYRSSADSRIEDPDLGRAIVVGKVGSRSTVLWNPWVEKSRRLADFGDEEYVKMLCIESANVRPHAVELAASETHELAVSLESVRLDG
jgi:glucose-6-phosphate 1-epimerase